MSEKMKAWSFSKLNTFDECPKKFRFIYLDRLEGMIKSDAMAIGEGIHEFVEFYSINPQASLSDCEDVYIKAAINATSLVDEKKVGLNLGIVDWYMKSGKVLTPYRSPNSDKPVTEKWFKLDCGEGIRCNGKIDIVTKNECVVDYKSAKTSYTKQEAEEVHQILQGKGLQLTIYTGAFFQWFKRLPKKVGLQVIPKDYTEIQNIGSTRTEKDIDAVKKYILNCHKRYLRMLEMGVFPKGLNPKCFWCNFRDDCRSEV